MFLRLWVRAPRMMMASLAEDAGRAVDASVRVAPLDEVKEKVR